MKRIFCFFAILCFSCSGEVKTGSPEIFFSSDASIPVNDTDDQDKFDFFDIFPFDDYQMPEMSVEVFETFDVKETTVELFDAFEEIQKEIIEDAAEIKPEIETVFDTVDRKDSAPELELEIAEEINEDILPDADIVDQVVDIFEVKEDVEEIEDVIEVFDYVNDDSSFSVIVHFSSDPDESTVTLNGEVQGVTPFDLQLEPGDYTAVYYRQGCEQKEKDFTVEVGDLPFEVFAELLIYVALDSDPQNAAVDVDYVFECNTPCTASMYSGWHNFDFALPPYETQQVGKNITVDDSSVFVSWQTEFSVGFITNPPGAILTIDSEQHAELTPVNDILLSWGDHQINLSLTDYYDVDDYVFVDHDGQIFEYDMQLIVYEVTINTVPEDAEVSLDQTNWFASPHLFDLTAGSHFIYLQHPDFENEQFSVEVDQLNTDFTLTMSNPVVHEVIISAVPEDAEVSLDQTNWFASPHLFDLAAGSYTVYARHPYYEDFSDQIGVDHANTSFVLEMTTPLMVSSDITSTPLGAAVLADGDLICEAAPCLDVSLVAGEYFWEFSLENHYTESFSKEIIPADPDVHANLTELPEQQISILTEDTNGFEIVGAIVTLDNQIDFCETPCLGLTLHERTYDILINKHGNNPFEQQFTVTEAQTEYTFVLENMSPLISVDISTQPQGMLVDLDSQTGICMTNCNSVFTGPGTHLVVIRDPNEIYQTETLLYEFLQAGDELFVQMTQ